MNWRQQQALDDYRDAQKPCTCENNGDLCNSCQAREAIGMSKTPAAALAAEEYKRRERRNAARREKHDALTSLGLKRVKGALGGTYYE